MQTSAPTDTLDVFSKLYAVVLDAPSEENRAAAAALAHEFMQRQTLCQRCGQPDPGLHFIAPNVYGDPEVYCVQMPAYTVVDSASGTGRMKHWGSPYGCQSVSHEIDSGRGEPAEGIGPFAAYLYGRPLPAAEVIARAWCSRCQDKAALRGQPEAERDSKQVEKRVRRLARVLGEYYSE